MRPDTDLLKLAWACKCPKCRKGDIFKPGLSLDLRDKCENCGLDLSKNDSADGPAVFLIFILGFSVVPLALIVDLVFHPPLWLHIAVWSAVLLGATIGLLKPIKTYIIALQFKHRPGDWES